MRAVFFEKLREVFDRDPRLFFLTGDTGFNLVEPLFQAAPDRALNVGVAEQNLVGVAAGLCNAGFIPVCYAITNFLVHRCLEQMRNDICLHGYKVIFAGTSTGYDNGALGATHHMVDDIGCLKVLPNLNLYSPSSRQSMGAVFEEVLGGSASAFIRITKADFSIDGPVSGPNHYLVGEGNGPLVISHGRMVRHCFEAHGKEGGFAVFAMDRIKPLDNALLENLFHRHSKIFVVEDNFRSGLYNSLCQWAMEHKFGNVSLSSISPEESFERSIGDTDYLDARHGLTPDQIRAELLRETKPTPAGLVLD
jgi:transketolase